MIAIILGAVQKEKSSIDVFVENTILSAFGKGKFHSKEDMKQMAWGMMAVYQELLDDSVSIYGGSQLLDYCFEFYQNANKSKGSNVYISQAPTKEDPIVGKQLSKYLIELIIKKHPTLYDIEMNDDVAKKVLHLAEQVRYFANLFSSVKTSDFIEYFEVFESPETGDLFFEFGINEDLLLSQSYECNRDIELFVTRYSQEYSKRQPSFQTKFLDDVFLKEFGYLYADYLMLLSSIWYPIPEQPQSVYNVKTKDLISAFVGTSGFSEQQIEQMLDSVTISYKNLQGRNILKPNDQHRLYSRFLIRYEANGESYYVWNQLMCEECWNSLIENFMAGIIPIELDTKNTRAIIGEMSRLYTKAFERYAGDKLVALGHKGKSRSAGKPIGSNGTIVLPRAGVGEIDWIGLDIERKKVVVFEFKTNKKCSSPIQQSADIDKFLIYGDKFLKKIMWVQQNLGTIRKDLQDIYGIPLMDFDIESIMITETRTIYSAYENRFKVIGFSSYFEEQHIANNSIV